MVDLANKAMTDQITTPQYTTTAKYEFGAYPMIPPAAKAENCIACHASAEVNRPYDQGQTVLGYTFVAKPIPQ